MIHWESIHYNINKAAKDFSMLEVKAKSIEPINFLPEFKTLREDLISARDEIFEENDLDGVGKLDYQFDLMFGLRLYGLLNEKNGFTNRVATNDDIWRYLSINVIPDIVHSRWSLNEERFYKNKRRIWLKSIWWYIHLSWRGNEEETYKVLQNNTTDTLLQLVERPGLGYYVEMYRELMYQYSKVNHLDKNRDIFRRVLKLNTVRLLTTSPELEEDGIQGYVNRLFLVTTN